MTISRWVMYLVAVVLLAAPALAGGNAPLLLVLCEHFDIACPYRIDGSTLVASAKPTSVVAPHDAAWRADTRMLYMAADYKERPCIIPYRVDGEGAMTRIWDPIPTRDRGPRVLLAGEGRVFVLAWSRAHIEVFPIDAATRYVQTPVARADGVEALVALDRTRLVTLRGGRLQAWSVADDGGLRAVGAPVDAGRGASSLALDPDGRTLYALTLEDFDHHIRAFDIAPSGEPRRSEMALPRTLQEAQRRMFMHGDTAYVLNATNSLSVYARRGGGLAELGKPMRTADGFEDLLFVGPLAYAVAATEPAVAVYRVLSDGRLRAGRPQPLPSGASGTRLLLLQ